MDQEYLISHWKKVRAALIATIDKFQDAELDYRPFADAWSVREFILHIAQEESIEFHTGIAQDSDDVPAYNVQDYPNKASLKTLLASVHTTVGGYPEKLSADDLGRIITTPWGSEYHQIEMIGHIIEHEIHHRGELSLMLGMLGHAGLDA